MKTVGIIAEYNPFHNGHAWQIQEARKQTDADYVIVVMSPDFVQRGEPALVSSSVRTQMALEGGADLVIALPAAAATGSAGQFAQGAVNILHGLGCVDYLVFGAETPDAVLLKQTAALLADEPAAFKETLRSELAAGRSYPQAREAALMHCLYLQDAVSDSDKALRKKLAEKIHHLCSQSNNILALEYMAALIRCNSTIRPLPLPRKGSAYLDLSFPEDTDFASASAIRASLTASPEHSADSYSAYMPASQAVLLQNELSKRSHPYAVYHRYDSLLQYCLWEHSDHLDSYLDISPDLARRIQSCAFQQTMTAAALVDAIKSRQLTASRVRRALLHVFLSLPQEAGELCVDQNAAYARIAGFKKTSAPLLHRMKETAFIPLISKNADAHCLLNGQAQTLFQQDLHAGDLYAFLEGRENFRGSSLRTSPIIHRNS